MPSEILKSLRSAKITIGEYGNIECHHLENGQRVITKRSFMEAIGLKGRGNDLGYRLNQFISLPILKSERIKKLSFDILNPILFKMNSGPIAYGYEGTLLVEYCKAILEARRFGYMDGEVKRRYALRCEAFIIGCAKVGIIALIDEATGYSRDKKKDEYLALFKEFIRDEVRGWEKEFPDQFFEAIYQLYGLKKTSSNHPQFFGMFIRKYVYTPLANSSGAVLDLLDEKNPVVYKLGGRKYRMHQFLSDQIGLPALRAHLWQIVGIAGSVRSRGAFEAAFYRVFPRPMEQDSFDFDV